ncbi:DUF6639 family protein [Halovulum sp. GXIMD14794]
MACAVLFAETAGALHAAERQCSAGITAQAGTGVLAERVCEAVSRVAPTLEACGVAPDQSIDIVLVDALEAGCVGVYHCGERRIEALSPNALDDSRSRDGAFSSVSLGSYFDSVIAHELAHAAYDSVPCPLKTCRVTAEYIAYAMQVLSLPIADRTAFEAGIPDLEVSRSDFSTVLLGLSPERFAQDAWRHFSNHPRGCDYIRSLIAGEDFLDRPRP